MSENLNGSAKDNVNDEAADTRTTRSDELPNRGKERRKLSKKKMFRSAAKRRLRGGADVETPAPEPAPVKEDDAENGQESEGGSLPAEASQEAANERQPLPSTGDPKVDEMLECALQNLEEAGKALASLGENLEHELKLFLVELMGRTRKWTGHVEGKIEWTRKDILELHKELAKNIAALAESRREALELKEQLANQGLSKSLEIHRNRLYEEAGTQVMGGKSVPNGVRSSMSVCSKEPSEEEERLRNCCAELEAEVLELRKENEKIVKERAEYENAIQRALLKGVSSLNVEALKVLRCTPIPTCCPPPPCPPSSTIEPMSKRDCSSPKSPKSNHCGGGGYGNDQGGNGRNGGCGGGGGGRNAGGCGGYSGNNGGCGGYNGNGAGYGNNGRNGGCGGTSREALNNMGSVGGSRRICPSAGHAEKKSRKSRDSNMLLLLHQKDAENFGINSGSNHCDNASKKQTICGGGPCGKSGKSNNYMC